MTGVDKVAIQIPVVRVEMRRMEITAPVATCAQCKRDVVLVEPAVVQALNRQGWIDFSCPHCQKLQKAARSLIITGSRLGNNLAQGGRVMRADRPVKPSREMQRRLAQRQQHARP